MFCHSNLCGNFHVNVEHKIWWILHYLIPDDAFLKFSLFQLKSLVLNNWNLSSQASYSSAIQFFYTHQLTDGNSQAYLHLSCSNYMFYHSLFLLDPNINDHLFLSCWTLRVYPKYLIGNLHISLYSCCPMWKNLDFLVSQNDAPTCLDFSF